MRAFVVSALSDDLSGAAMQDAPMPELRPGEALLKVLATSVNFPDYLQCQGKYQHKPALPFTPGSDVCGEVIALAPGAQGVRVGEIVVGATRTGGFAEFAAAPIAALAPKPAALSVSEAAAYPTIYLTAYVALVRRAQLAQGETLLVHGAAGGTGIAAIDLGKLLGARVIATGSTEEKRSFLHSYGADHVLAPKDFREEVKALTEGRGADVIFDPVGGDVFDESVRCIAFDGRLLVIGFTSGRIPSIAANMPLIKGFSVMGVRAGEYGRRFPERGRENRAAIAQLAGEGRIRPHVGAELPLECTREALGLLETRRAIGKVVVRPSH